MSSLEMISNQWSLANIQSCWKKATALEAWTEGDGAVCCPVARHQGTARKTPVKSLLLNALFFTQMKLHCLEQRPNTGWKGEVPGNLGSVRCWKPFVPGFAAEKKNKLAFSCLLISVRKVFCMEREMKKNFQLLVVNPRVEKRCPNRSPSETMGPRCIACFWCWFLCSGCRRKELCIPKVQNWTK